MALRIAGVLMVVSFVFALATGNMSALSEAAVNGAGKAVTVTFALLGTMCLWCGILRVCEKLGALSWLSRCLSPILRRIFPNAYRCGRGINEITAALAANILGIGNAATPLAISAMQAMAEGNDDTATDDMVTFTVLGTAFPSFFPTTIIALRTAAGSRDPMCVLPAVWICSLLLSLFAVFLSRTLRKVKKHP